MLSLSWLLLLACKDKSPVVEDTASSEWTWSQVAWRPMAAVPGGSMDFVVMGDGDPATVLAASNNNGLFVATTDDPSFTKSNDPELAPHFYAAPVLQTTPLERMVVGSSNQVLVSTDDGATFERLMTLPDLLTGLAVREGRIVVTAATPAPSSPTARIPSTTTATDRWATQTTTAMDTPPAPSATTPTPT